MVPLVKILYLQPQSMKSDEQAILGYSVQGSDSCQACMIAEQGRKLGIWWLSRFL